MTLEEILASAIWKCIPSDDDVTWVDKVARPSISESPLGDYGALVQEMLDKGMSAGSIARFAKIVGYETAYSICYALDDPDLDGIEFDTGEEDKGNTVTWKLFRTDPDTDKPASPISSCYELLLSADPSGNEMKPPVANLLESNNRYHAAYIAEQSKFRGRWLAYYSKKHFRSVEISTDLLPVSVEPMWPGRRVAVLLASTDTETWILSDGLSDRSHPSDDMNSGSIITGDSPEVLSRVPKGSVDFWNTSEELAQNPDIQLFIKISCLCLKLQSERLFGDNNHIVAPIDTDTDDSLVLFSNAESMNLAEPILLPDHDYLRTQVLFASLIDQADKETVESDVSAFSQTLSENDRLGALAT